MLRDGNDVTGNGVMDRAGFVATTRVNESSNPIIQKTPSDVATTQQQHRIMGFFL